MDHTVRRLYSGIECGSLEYFELQIAVFELCEQAQVTITAAEGPAETQHQQQQRIEASPAEPLR